MQLVALRHAFDRQDIGAIGLRREHGAGFHRSTVEVDGAAAALGGIATDMRAGHAEMIAQEIDQQGAVLDIARVALAVNSQFNFGHGQLQQSE
jgi:hypothetical protein